ncbi:heme o synthase [Salinicola rhizosphaerae]|uniref:Protoheme IX farnesyltransferase n=1 Tax=Salinicola rhizosphaerae TaxID=1443141 RepID=A0ABQ3DR30_9GAMM|nr:heme o synthase [Salinicola rhizosphaerae]GHB09177.1 protoheme IX farnesyltransferase [Salinicola rhizosphaerae]
MALKPYLLLAKPGIIFGNLITVIGGYFLAAGGHFDLILFLAAVLGTSLVVASGCVFNNVIDRDIDSHMARTQSRAMVTGQISIPVALLQATLLGAAGFSLLAWQTTALATAFAAFGFAIYVGAYSLYLKRNSVYSTLIGSLSGASPPVIGYCAVTGTFDLGALLLLVIFSMWQMPHSYAIAIFRFNDYASASIPVLPVKRGVDVAKRHIVYYTVLFVIASVMLTLAGYTGWIYAIVAIGVGLYWLAIALRGYRAGDDAAWARKVFGISIMVVTALSVMMSIDSRLPMTEPLLSLTMG